MRRLRPGAVGDVDVDVVGAGVRDRVGAGDGTGVCGPEV